MPDTPTSTRLGEGENAATPPADRLAETARAEPGRDARADDATGPTLAAGARQDAATAGPPDPEGLPFGRYRLLEELGRGGMGLVWRAWDTELKRPVALKQILGDWAADEARIERFFREARLAARLHHPNIVRVYDVGILDGEPAPSEGGAPAAAGRAPSRGGHPFYTSELIEGTSLDRRMREEVPPRQAALWVRETAIALAAAHDQGVVHRDVKPANVLIDPGGRVHVADFGLAREVELSREAPLTASGDVVGTPSYMSPEQTWGRRDLVGPASDQFSLGVVLYELLTGRLPFAAPSVLELFLAISEEEPLRPSRRRASVPPELDAICLKALEKDPARRYASMRELADDLGRWLEGEPVLARAVSFPTRLARRARRHRAVVIPTLAAVAVAFGVFTWLRIERAREQDLEAARRADDVRRAEEARLAEGASVERNKARREVEAAEDALRKADLVSWVLLHWADVQGPLEQIERSASAFYLPAAEREKHIAEVWPVFERFAEGTLDDATSQAATLGLLGWAQHVAGRDADARASFAASRRLDADVPFGALMEALVAFSDYVEGQPLPPIATGSAGVVFGPARGEPAGLAGARERIEALVAEAERARVWGKEGAGEHRSAILGMRAMQRGDYEAAEAALSRAAAAAELRAARSVILLARAKVRYLRHDFEGAIADGRAVLARRPASPPAWSYLGLFQLGAAAVAGAKGEDPRITYGEAIQSLDHAISLYAEFSDTFVYRAAAHAGLGSAGVAHGRDPRFEIDRALADYDEAERLLPENAFECALGRASALRTRAEWQLMRGEDATATLERSLAECDRGARGGSPSAIVNRALAHLRLGDARARTGEDPERELAAAIADFDAVIAKAPTDAGLLYQRGQACWTRGDARQRRGEDPTADYEAAVADHRAALEASPGYKEPHHGLGMAWTRRGEWEAAHGTDPRPSLDRAIEEYGRVLATDPKNVLSLEGRALARLDRGPIGEADEGIAALTGAIADLDLALSLSNPRSDDLNHRGLARMHLGKRLIELGKDPAEAFEGSAADFRESIRRFPAFWRSHANLALLLETMGRPAEAVAEYETAIRIAGAVGEVLRPHLERARQAEEQEVKPGGEERQ